MLLAALMSINALAIDAMIPALPAIGEALGVASENERQLIVSVYFLVGVLFFYSGKEKLFDNDANVPPGGSNAPPPSLKSTL